MADKRRGGYPSDVTDEEVGVCVAVFVALPRDSPQRKYEMRTVFNAVR
jgi:transposase